LRNSPPRTTAAMRLRIPVLLPDFGLPFAAAQSSVVMSPSTNHSTSSSGSSNQSLICYLSLGRSTSRFDEVLRSCAPASIFQSTSILFSSNDLRHVETGNGNGISYFLFLCKE